MTIAQLQLQWTGNVPGLPGYCILWVNSTAASPTPLANFASSLAQYVPSSITLTVPASGRLVNELDGKTTGTWANGTNYSVLGTGSATYVPQAGAQIKWTTNQWVRGKRVVGRNYLVPLANGIYVGGGVILQATATAIAGFGTTMISAYTGNLVVWHRPFYNYDVPEGQDPILVRQGSTHPISTATVPIKPATLNKRRDA